MRSKLPVIITAFFIFGVGLAVYAYNATPTNGTIAASCCCSGDSCPMRSADCDAAVKAEGKHSCSCCAAHAAKATTADGKTEGGHSGCGDSCPMKAGHKMNGMDGHKMDADMKHEKMMGGGESCPMMKGGKMAEMHKGTVPGDAKTAEMHKGMNRGKAAGCP